MRAKVLLIDAYATIYRAFFAIRSLSGVHGEPVNAVFGFTKMVQKLQVDHRPTHCAVAFDRGAPEHRLRVLPDYKAQRPPTPPDLEIQIPWIREVLAALRTPIVEIEGEEADDIIATLAVQSARTESDVCIASPDKDFMQIVSSRIRLIRPNGKEAVFMDESGVKSRYGVLPGQMVDFLSLVGDSVDNIRGVAGIGEKTAAELLRQYGTMEHLLGSLPQIEKPKLRDALRASADRLRINRQVIALRCDLILPVTVDDLKVLPPDWAKLSELFQRFGFKSLLANLQERMRATPDLFAF